MRTCSIKNARFDENRRGLFKGASIQNINAYVGPKYWPIKQY